MLEILGYQTIVTIHLVSFVWNVLVVVLADVLGLLWMLGVRKALHTRLMHALHWSVWAGLAVSITSGIVLFTEASSYLLSQPAFWVKVTFVGALVVNSFVISHHLHAATSLPFRDVTPRTKRGMLISAGVSIVSWITVAIAATQLGL